MLHGVGSNERDLLDLAPHLDGRFRIFSLRAPHQIAPDGFAWFELEFTAEGPIIDPEQAEVSRAALVEFVSRLPEAHPVRRDQVYLLGFSQGAIMSIALTLTQPKLLAGVVAISGRTLPELFAERGPLAGKLAPKEDLRGFPILVAHGIHDRVLRIAYARDTRKRLQAYPVDLTYREYDMPHAISEECLRDVSAWLSVRLDAPLGAGAAGMS